MLPTRSLLATPEFHSTTPTVAQEVARAIGPFRKDHALKRDGGQIARPIERTRDGDGAAKQTVGSSKSHRERLWPEVHHRVPWCQRHAVAKRHALIGLNEHDT